jgi:hypothetical protein
MYKKIGTKLSGAFSRKAILKNERTLTMVNFLKVEALGATAVATETRNRPRPVVSLVRVPIPRRLTGKSITAHVARLALGTLGIKDSNTR